eukprot:6877447-Prymnesium_polylepis.1
MAAPDKFAQLKEEEEAAAKRQSWTPEELQGVPLPGDLTETSQCPTEAVLAEQFGGPTTSEARSKGRHRMSMSGPRRDSERSVDSEPNEVSVKDKCRGAVTSVWAKATSIPITKWGPHYSRALLRADVMAGLTVGVVLIPQGVAYAMLAELPPIYGAHHHRTREKASTEGL